MINVASDSKTACVSAAPCAAALVFRPARPCLSVLSEPAPQRTHFLGLTVRFLERRFLEICSAVWRISQLVIQGAQYPNADQRREWLGSGARGNDQHNL